MKLPDKETQKTILVIQLIIIIILESIILYGPSFKSYLKLKSVKAQNEAIIKEIQDSDIIKKTSENTDKSSEILDPLKLIERNIPTKIPEKAYLEVPFICQAPLETNENWTHHEESCEEAALLMAYLYEQDKEITKEEANTEILNMIDWQIEKWGSHHDIYAQDLKKFAISYYQIEPEKIKIIQNATLEQIKEQISKGHPVIVPITGEILKNPYYPHPGYHMLVVIGYTETHIITNDNGTRHGADFSYEYDVFESAMNDTGGDIMILEL